MAQTHTQQLVDRVERAERANFHALHTVESKYEKKIDELEMACQGLTRELNHAIDNLRQMRGAFAKCTIEEAPGYISSRGIVQTRGMEIDKACSELSQLVDFYKLLKS